MSPWSHAELIYLAFNVRRRELGFSAVEVDLLTGVQKSKKNKTLHNYHDRAMYRPCYLQRLLPESTAVQRMSSAEDWMFTPARLVLVGEAELLQRRGQVKEEEEEEDDDARDRRSHGWAEQVLNQGDEEHEEPRMEDRARGMEAAPSNFREIMRSTLVRGLSEATVERHIHGGTTGQ